MWIKYFGFTHCVLFSASFGKRIHIFKNLSFYSQVWGDPEKEMTPHSSTFAWKIPWAEEPGRLQSMGSLRVGHDWETLLSLFAFMHWRRKWQPTPVFLPGESQGQGSLVAAVYGVTQSRTRMKWLSIAWCYIKSIQLWAMLFNRKKEEVMWC